MTAWTSDELARIGSAEELEIAPRRQDGALARPRTIWWSATAMTCTSVR
jgi:hypothetical protein